MAGEGLRRHEQPASLKRAERVLKDDFLGIDAVNTLPGVKLEKAPPLVWKDGTPISERYIEGIAERKNQLILDAGLSLKTIQDGTSRFHNGKPMWYNKNGWFKNEPFSTETTSLRWRETSPDVIPGTLEKNYLEQTDVFAEYLKQYFKGMPEAERAIDEFDKKRADIERLMRTDWQAASQALANLTINKLFRTSPRQDVQDIALNNAKGKIILPDTYNWMNARTSRGVFVGVGYSAYGGALVDRHDPRYSSSIIGARFSRS